MKKILTVLFAGLLITVCLCGCVSINFTGLDAVVGKGVPEKYSFTVGDFNEIYIEMFCNIEYYAGDSGVVTLEIQPNLTEYVTVENTGGVLNVRATRSISWSEKAPVLTVSIPTLKGVTYAGAGDFKTHDIIQADSFSLIMSGAGSVNAGLDVNELFVSLSGAGHAEFSGNADYADINLLGAGGIDAMALQTADARVAISGVGSVRVNCSENLRIIASGLGSVEYSGSAKVDIKNEGLTSIKKIG